MTTPVMTPVPPPQSPLPKWVERALHMLANGKIPPGMVKTQVLLAASSESGQVTFEGFMLVLEHYEARGIPTERVIELQRNLELS